MYGRDVVALSTCEPYKVRGKALEWGSMSIRSLCLFLFISVSCLEHGAQGGHAMTNKMVNSILVRGKALDGVIW